MQRAPIEEIRVAERGSSPVSNASIKRLFFYMLLARALDERMWILNRQGKAPFVLSCQGHEGISAGAALALEPGVDWIAPYYRDLAMVLMFGMTPQEVMLGFFGRAEDPSSGGRQMPAHYGHAQHKILTGSSPVATQVAHIVGIALANKIRGIKGVALASLGEGSTNQGEFHEAMNFAAVQRVPAIVLVHNNGYAISTPLVHQVSVQDLSLRAQGYGILGVTVDGTQPLAVYEAVKAARERALAGQGPTLIEAKTYRLTPHSSDDDDRAYKSEEVRQQERRHDVMRVFSRWAKDHGYLSASEEQDITREVLRLVDEAVEYALGAPTPDPTTLGQHLYGS